MTEITIKLSEEDRALLSAVKAGLAKLAKGKPSPKDAAEAGDDGFEDVDGEADTGGDDSDADGGDADAGGDDDFGDETETTETAKPSRDDVRAALKAYATAGAGQAKAIALMKQHGGSSALSALKEAKFAAVIKAAKEATAKLKKK